MALNINFAGKCYTTDGNLADTSVRYRVYFNKVNSSSAPSQWDTYESVEGQVRRVEAVGGFWSFNLGDAGLLSQSQTASAGDRVVVTFFKDYDDKDSDNIRELGTYYWTLTSAENYTIDIQLVSVDETANTQCKPDLSQWRLNSQGPSGTSNGVVNTNYAYSSVNCDYVRQHIYTTDKGNVETYHYWQLFGTVINDGFRIVLRQYDFDEGSGWQTLGSSGNYQWAYADDYQCLLHLTTGFGNSDESVRFTNDIELVIFYRQPVPDIDCLQSVVGHIVTPDTPVFFKYSGSDIDTRITGIDWVIYDSTNSYHVDQASSTIVGHYNGPGTGWYGHPATPGAYGTSGTHNVAIVVHWDNGIDGTNTTDVTYDEDFIQDLFSGPTLGIDQIPEPTIFDSTTSFVNTSTNTSRVGTAGIGEEYDWRLDDDGSITDVLDVPFSYIFKVAASNVSATVRLVAHWNDGFSDQTTSLTINIVFQAKITITQEDCYYVFSITGSSTGGGAPTGYRWRIFRDPDGSNTLIWTSPTDIDQESRRYYFTHVDTYRIEGSVYGAGSPTLDTEDVEITDICPAPEDATSFYVVTTDPLNDETGESISNPVRVVFNENVNINNLINRFIVKDSENNVVDGAVSVSGPVGIFTPFDDLEYEETYTSTVLAGVSNITGTLILQDDYTWSFTTRDEGGEEVSAGGIMKVEEEIPRPLIFVKSVKEKEKDRATIVVTSVRID